MQRGAAVHQVWKKGPRTSAGTKDRSEKSHVQDIQLLKGLQFT